MSHNRDSSPVYYREIQKNAYLKRLPDESSSKLRPLVLKKPPPKPLWTQLCVHNGRTPYLEQYRDPTSARAHRPIWRVCLQSARHVTASVTSRDNEYDFLVDTNNGPVRMLAPDWESMQDWVVTLRSKLHELKIVSPCENVYCAPPAAPLPRAAARDPTSPLPPTPPVPPDRVPGIDLTPIVRPTTQTETQQNESPSVSSPLPTVSSPLHTVSTNLHTVSTNLHTVSSTLSTVSTTLATVSSTLATVSSSLANVSSHLPTATSSLPTVSSSLSTATLSVPTVTSSLPTTKTFLPTATTSLPSVSQSLPTTVSSLPTVSTPIDISSWDTYTPQPSTSQVTKSVAKICGQNICLDDSILKRSAESDDDFDLSDDSYKQMVVVNDELENGAGDRPTNITVIKVSNKEPPHTAIPVIGNETDVFDFDFKNSRKNDKFVNIVNTEVNVQNTNDYGTVFDKNTDYGHLSLTTTVSLTGHIKNDNLTDNKDVNVKSDSDSLYEKLCLASSSESPLPVRRLKCQEKLRKSSLPNLDTVNNDSTYEYLFLTHNNGSGNTSLTNTVVSTNTAAISTNAATISTIANTVSVTANESAISTTPAISTNTSTVSPNVSTVSTNGTAFSTVSTNNTSNVLLNSDNRVHIQSVSILDSHSRELRSNIERTQSQNAYDVTRIDNGPKRNGKFDRSEPLQPKPIWRRGLTELSLLSRLRIGQANRQDNNTNGTQHKPAVTSPAKVVHRSRPEVRVDRNRRRSSSLTNGIPQSPPPTIPPLLPLRARQAETLRSEQRRGAALVATVRSNEPVFVDYEKQVWVAAWGLMGSRAGGRCGDRVCGVAGLTPKHAAHARQIIANTHKHLVDILFHRVPLGRIYVVNKKDQEPIGIKLDNECNITSVCRESPAARAGLPPPGKWALTEVNNRPLNLAKGGEEDMNRLSLHGTEASILIQPSALVKKLRAAIKGNKGILGLR